MSKMILVTLSACALTFACSDNKQKKNAEATISEIESTKDQQDNTIASSDSSVVKIALNEGKGKAIIQKKQDQIIYIEFENKGYKKLSAHLSSPDSLANIRFSQIFLTDGTMDGPFSRDLNYDLPTNGTYRISIHENMMAGDPWKGNFSVDISLTK